MSEPLPFSETDVPPADSGAAPDRSRERAADVAPPMSNTLSPSGVYPCPSRHARNLAAWSAVSKTGSPGLRSRSSESRSASMSAPSSHHVPGGR